MPTVRFLLYGKIPDHHAIIDAINGADYAFHAFRRGPLTNVYNPICVPTLASQGNEDGSSASLPMLIYEPKKYLDKYQWDITGMNFTPVVGDALIDGINYVGDIPRFSQVSAFDAWVIKRFQQPITESYFTTISCPSSIRTAGKNHRSYNHAVQADYTGDRITNQWTETVQETIDYEVSKFGQAIVGGYGNSFIGNTCLESVNITVNRYAVGYPFEPPDQNVLSFSGSYKPLHWDRDKNPIDGRSKMQEAYEAVHSRVIKEIVASHRGSAVTFDTPLHPPVELSSTVQLRLGYDVNENIPKFNAKGKATRIVHRLNLQSGEATTSVTFALIKNLSTGIQFTAPQVDVPAQLQWGQCPHLPRIYTLSSWPPRVEDLWPGSNFVTPRPSTFRGWDFMTGEMIIESPNLPPEANFSAVKIISNAIKFEPPDDLLEMEQIP
jgi:hypothetical protein